MRAIGYALVDGQGSIVNLTGSLPWSPPPPGNPLGRLATFDAVGQSADGYTVVERVETEPAHRFQVAGTATEAFNGTRVVVDRHWADLPLNTAKLEVYGMIKGKANELILARYPEFKQSNMIARQGELHRIEVGLMRDEQGNVAAARSLTSQEEAEMRVISGAWAWIKAVRVRSNVMEGEVAALSTVAAVAAYEMTGWPA